MRIHHHQQAKMTINNLLNSLCFEEHLKQRLIVLFEKGNKYIDVLCDLYKNGFDVLKFQNSIVRLAVCIKYAVKYTYPQYVKRGIDRKIFFDTLSDIVIWCENNNNKGLKNYRWIKNHLDCNLFRLGRLQFQFFVCNSIQYDYKKLPFNFGDKVIFIHIPQGEKLNKNYCIESIKEASAFFDRYFSEFEYEYYFCDSWLLYENNKLFMDVNSNIIKFQSLFDVGFSVNDDSQSIQRIFGVKSKNISSYSENTTLQKAAKIFLLNGGKLGRGVGCISKNKY